MVNEPISIMSSPFWKYRTLMDHCLKQAINKMELTNTEEGSVTGRINIRLKTDVNKKTGEVTMRPGFEYEISFDVPVKGKTKESMDEAVILYRGEDGKLMMADEQVSVEDILQGGG